MKKSMVILCAVLLVFGVVGTVNATLTTIGTATYGGQDYNLIYEDVQHLVWLDYTHVYMYWDNQMSWAAGLNNPGVLTYNLNCGVSISWAGNWRLPTTDVATPPADQSAAYGYNKTNSEMGYLFYTELGNKGLQAPDGTNPQPGWGLTNKGPFNNLQTDRPATYYWSGTEFFLNGSPPFIGAWLFDFNTGIQANGGKDYDCWALAVRTGDVVSAPVPEPATMLLLGCGLIGLAGWRRKFK